MRSLLYLRQRAEEKIRESKVAQGDLVFIIHRDKDYKSGWYRKLRTHTDEIVFVLESPVTLKPFEVTDNSRVEDRKYVIRNLTIREDPEKYKIIIDARGVGSSVIATNGYRIIDAMSFVSNAKNKADITFTEEAVDLYYKIKALIEVTKTTNRLDTLAEYLMQGEREVDE